MPRCGMAAWTSADIPDQSGRVALVTGANSGLGLRTSLALAAKGARVLMGCRNEAKAATARQQVAKAGGEAEVVALDLADLSSVQACAEAVASQVDHLDLLVNNAGVLAHPHRLTADGFEMQFGTNHLGHFALTGRLLPTLLAAEGPRVVTVSSSAHKMGRMQWDDLMFERRYRKWLAYGQSKLANLLFTFELDRRAAAAGTPLLAAAGHPGYANTHLQTAGPEISGSNLMVRGFELGNRLLAQSDEMGALPQLYAATMPDVVGGEYFGPDRLGEIRGHPTRVRATSKARDGADGTRLWSISEELTGVTYPWPTAS
ncbi:oxidoreductase [soil metagenome]